MAIPAHPSADRPRSAAESAPSSRRAPESTSGNGYLSQLSGTINQSPRVRALKATAEMVNSPARVTQTKQREVEAEHPAQFHTAAAPAPNRTGLPDGIKSGVESLSGMSLDNVKVHYNSAQPAQLNALAYAQGPDIHVAPGQEEHLPHEAWHVVQQAQGRVKPTMQMKDGPPVNDEAGLEHEANVMGARAGTVGRWTGQSDILNSLGISPPVVQLKWIAGARPNLLMWDKPVEGAQWYYSLPDGRMFYSRGNYISDVLSREGWLEEGASELEDQDGEVVDVRDQPPADRQTEASQPWRIVVEQAPSGEAFRASAGHLNAEWRQKAETERTPPPSAKQDHECSGADWTTVHEGVDVSADVAKEGSTQSCAIPGGISTQYVALYAAGGRPIALMMLETRQELPNELTPAAPHMYIRWLLSSPDRRGGGGVLVEYAKIVAHLQGLARAVSVESAASAVEWYTRQGYTPVAASTHEDEDQPCRCVYLAWPPAAAGRMRAEHARLLEERTKKRQEDDESEE